MVKSKRSNQMTRKDKKRLEEKNNQSSIKKPASDRMPSEDGINVICKVEKEYGGKRFGCIMVNIQSLNIDAIRKAWDLIDLQFETEIKAKLKGSIRNNSYSKVNVGNYVMVSYGDTINFVYTPEETNYINSKLVVKSITEEQDVEFCTEEQDEQDEQNKQDEQDKQNKQDEQNEQKSIKTLESNIIVDDDINFDDI